MPFEMHPKTPNLNFNDALRDATGHRVGTRTDAGGRADAGGSSGRDFFKHPPPPAPCEGRRTKRDLLLRSKSPAESEGPADFSGRPLRAEPVLLGTSLDFDFQCEYRL